MGIVLALASALLYGLSDVVGGLLSRRSHFLAVAIAGQIAALLLTCGAAPLVTRAAPGPADLGWGALSGVGSGLGMLFLFRGIGRGDMTVVVPVSAVTGIALPVVAGAAVFAERPSPGIWIGVALAVPSLWLVSRTASGGAMGTGAVLDGLAAGAGIALQYLALARAGAGSGIWPVAAGRLIATAMLMIIAAPHAGSHLRMPWPSAAGAAAAGALAGLALTLYLVAVHDQLVVVAVVLSSLYPVVPVLVGVLALAERLSWRQIVGLGGAAAAVLLIASQSAG